MPEKRRVIAVDLDGTLAHYDGWVNECTIGPPIQCMVDRIKSEIAAGSVVRVFTARASRNPHTVVPAIQRWLECAGLPALEVTCQKTYDISEIWDDRTRRVEKNTGIFADKSALLEKIRKWANGMVTCTHQMCSFAESFAEEKYGQQVLDILKAEQGDGRESTAT